ncbi:MAG: CarD family transcriptional regulator [Lachnospiraceae bacterium]|nr:CarD family transcriptional regulator [Lachnospiraceae bacterium]
MFEIGDYVMKTSKGVCHIDDITRLDMAGIDKDKLYYVMTPLDGKGSTLYVSVDTAESSIRAAMTKGEAEDVIDAIPGIEATWIDNEKLREQRYKEAVRSGSPEALIGIIKTIYSRKKMREDQGKKNTAVDERYFKQAEDLLYAEIAFALGKNKDEICEYITSCIRGRKSKA